MRPSRLLSMPLALLLLTLPLGSQAKTVFVATQGSDSVSCTAATCSTAPGACTSSNAKRNLSGSGGALACLVAGDTLYIRSGTYTEAITTNTTTMADGTSSQRILVSSYPGETGTVRSIGLTSKAYWTFDRLIIDVAGTSGEGVWLGGSSNHIRVSNSEIKNATVATNNGVHLVGTGGFHEFQKNNVHDNGSEQLHDHGFYIETGDNLIEGNNIHDNCVFGVQLNNANADRTIIRQNLIHNNGRCARGTSEGGIIVSGGSDNAQIYNNVIYSESQGIDHGTSTGTLVANNTIYAGDSDDFALRTQSVTSNATFINNIIYNPNGTSVVTGGTGISYSNNLCRTGTTGCAATTSTPGFVNAGTFDFHITTSSPAKDAGTATTVSSIFSTDYDSNVRPQPAGGAWDIGAYEFVVGGGSSPSAVLVGSYSFTTNANDAAGGDQNGTLNNGATAGGAGTGKVGPGLVLDGVDDSMTIASLFGAPTNLASSSICAWVNATAVDTSGGEIWSMGDHIILRLSATGVPTGQFYDGTTWQSISGGGDVRGGWHHLCYVYDNVQHTQTLYKDGVQVVQGTSLLPVVWTGQGSTTSLGRHAQGQTTYDLTGTLDEVNFYTGVLTLAEIQQLYNAGNVATAQLVAHYPLDGTLQDTSGHALDGMPGVGSPTYTTAARIGSNALTLNGSTQSVDVTDNTLLNVTTGFTLAAWVNPSQAMTTWTAIAVKNYRYFLYAASAGVCGAGAPLGGYHTGSVEVDACDPTPLPANTWTHLAITYDGANLKLYRNGNLTPVATAAATATLTATTGTLQIGASQYGENFLGNIDDVYLYNYARTAAEVKALYDLGTPTFGAPTLNTVTMNAPSFMAAPTAVTVVMP